MSYEKSFSLRLTYKTNKWNDGGVFVVTLENVSKIDLSVMLDSEVLEGEFSILSGKGKGESFCDRDYLRRRRSIFRILPHGI